MNVTIKHDVDTIPQKIMVLLLALEAEGALGVQSSDLVQFVEIHQSRKLVYVVLPVTKLQKLVDKLAIVVIVVDNGFQDILKICFRSRIFLFKIKCEK